MNVLYDPNKVNVVVNALNLLSMGCDAQIEDDKKELVRDAYTFACLVVQLVDSTKGDFMVHNHLLWRMWNL